MGIPTYKTNRTGAQVSDALQQMNERIPEGWAVGAADGVPVSSGSPFWHNNAKYYAEEAGVAAARAEAAVPVGTAGAVFFDRAQALTQAQQSQARANIAAGGSNPNLLDNWYFVGGGSQLGDGVFPINQRGWTSYTGSAATGVDRWWTQYDTNVQLTSVGLRITGNWDIKQRFARPLPDGTYTLSVDVASKGNTNPLMMTLNASYQQIDSFPITQNGINTYTFTSDSSNTVQGVSISLASQAGADITIRAMKLEKGTVSTLANDVPPDFGEELRKCQRYLWIKTFSGNTQLGSGVALTADQAIVSVVTPTSMRPAQNITLTANVLLVGNGQVATASAVTGINQYDNITRLTISSSGLTAYHTYSFFTTTETTMAIYAEP